MSDVRVHVICYNEEKILPFFIKSYRDRFHNCAVTVYDNYSTDETVLIANSFDCDIVNFSTNNQMSDSVHRDIKNSCWKWQKEEWAIVVDADEIITATEKDLTKDFNIWRFTGIQMVGEGESYDGIKFGVRDDLYSKAVLFNTFDIAEINYSVGAHICNPIAKDFCKPFYNEKIAALLHYKWVDLESVLNKHKQYAGRLSDENKANGWSSHYAEHELSQRNYYNDLLSKRIKVL